MVYPRGVPEPAIRASFFHANLAALSALGADAERRVRARIPAELLREIEEAARVAWLPVEHDVLLTDAIDAELGRAALRRWARDGVLRATEGPLLSPIVRSARAIFGITPASMLRRAPQAWRMLYRDCGRLVYEAVGERGARVELLDSPAVLLRSTPYLDGLGAGLEAAMVLTGHQGEARLAVDTAAGRARYACTW